MAILGPDGVGKSTIVAMLREEFADSAEFAKLGLHSRALNASSRPVRWLWRLYRAAGLAIRTHRSLARGRPVIWDRHPSEDRATRRVGRRVLTRGHGWLRALFPAPDVVIVLDAPEHHLFRRRQEQTLTELGRLRQLYLEIAEETPGAVVIDASGPVEEVFGAVLTELNKRGVFAGGSASVR